MTDCGRSAPEERATYRMEQPLEILSTDGTTAMSLTNVTFILEEPTPGLKLCGGGLADLAFPAAALGGTFFKLARRVIFDPFSSRVWIQPQP
jgi:hypothetical protein